MYFGSYSGFTPQHTSITSPRTSYSQSFTLTTTVASNSTTTVDLMLYLRSVTSKGINSYNHFNISNFRISGSTISFTLNVRYAVVQKFCISAVACNIGILKQNLLLNASSTPTATVNSSSLT